MKKRQWNVKASAPIQPSSRSPLLFGGFFYFLVFIVMNLAETRFGRIADFFFSMPMLISNRIYLFRNGPFHLPYYTPVLGGGLPAYADPQDMYFSVIQLVFLIFNDQKLAITASFAVCLFLNHVGFYVFLRHFGVTRWIATLGAMVFAMNGFVISRWSIGHLGFQVYWAIPLILVHVHKLYSLSAKRREFGEGGAAPAGRSVWIDILKSCVWIGMLMALCVYGSDIHAIYFVGVLIFTMLLCFGIMERKIISALMAVLFLVAVAGPFTVLLSLSKDVAVLDYLRLFGRETGNNIISVKSILWLIPNALFNPLIDVSSILPYKDISSWHENAAYVGVVTGICLIVGLTVFFWKKTFPEDDPKNKLIRVFLLWTVATYSVVGYLMMGDNAFWQLVKNVPVISSYHQISRFTATFPVLTIALVFLLLDLLRSVGHFRFAALILGAACLVDVLIYDANIDTSVHGAFSEHKFPSVRQAKVKGWDPGTWGLKLHQNIGDPCSLQPQFRPTGKTCADLDIKAPALAQFPDGTYNVNDPAAMIYPKETGKPAWSRLQVEGNEEKIVRFLNFENPNFFIPRRQIWANRISLVSWLVALLFLWRGRIGWGKFRVSSEPFQAEQQKKAEAR